LEVFHTFINFLMMCVYPLRRRVEYCVFWSAYS